MKATLEFNLPEETEEFNDAVNGWKWKVAISTLDNYLRGEIKYRSDLYTEQELILLEKVRTELHSHLEDSNLNQY